MPSPFVSEATSLASPFGPLLLGVVDVDRPGVAEGISRLLVRSIQDAREANDGHLPEWLVDDIEKNYISPAKIRTLWAATGHRFCVTHDGAIIGTIHVAKRHDVILTIDRHRVNVPAADHPGFKPARFHHVVNISVLHEVRRAGVGTLMVDGIVERFRHLFDGDGLWVRADPPWHAGLVGLGFEHDASMDVFLPEDAEKTAGLEHAAFNRRWACDCRVDAPAKPEALAARRDAMAAKKLQYVSFTRRFEAPSRTAPAAVPTEADVDARDATLDAFAGDFGGVHVRRPKAVATPRDVGALTQILARATSSRTRATIRGAGQSTEGQSLGDDLVVSTAGLDRVLAIEAGRVTVQGGVRWSALLAALGDATPPVVPGWLDATVGGSIATAGFGKGSHREGTILDHVLSLLVVTGDGRAVRCSPMQAGWLFDAVCGGFGQFGVVAEATLRTVPRAAPTAPRKTRVLPSEIAAALDAPDAFHTMAFASKDGPWVVRVAGPTEPATTAVATAQPRVMLQFLAPAGALSVAYATITHSLDWAHDTLVMHAIRRGRQGSLVPAVDADAVVALSALCAARPNIEQEHRAIAAALRSAGVVPTLFGVPPRDANEWRALLGDRHEAVLRAKRMADPAGILGAPAIALPTGEPASPQNRRA